jgi:hypothetical protein
MEEIRLTKNNIQTRSINDYEFLISKRRIIGMIIDVYDNPTKLANSILHYSIVSPFSFISCQKPECRRKSLCLIELK